MKTTILSLALAASAFGASAADFFSTERPEDTFNFGLRVGINTSNRTVNNDALFDSDLSFGYGRQSWGTGFDLGAVVDINIRNYLSIQPGFFFESRSGDYTFFENQINYGGAGPMTTQIGHMRSYAFNIPILASFHFNITDDIRWDVDFGPYVGFNLSSSLKDKVLQTNGITSEVHAIFDRKAAPVDFGFKFGTAFRILRHYYVGAHYMAGATRAWKNLELDAITERNYGGHTKAWVFTLGYDF